MRVKRTGTVLSRVELPFSASHDPAALRIVSIRGAVSRPLWQSVANGYAARSLVGRWLLNAIDHEDLDRSLRRHELEAKLILHSVN